ncbi:MAG: CHAT domain-containing protein [Candidatus Phosphoribacter sp.]
MTAPVGWLLTVEPFGTSIGWSLLRNDGNINLVDTAVIDDCVTLRQAALSVRPVLDARPGPDGRAGLWASALTRPEDELRAAVILGKGLLPEALRASLLDGSAHGRLDAVTVATRGWLAGIPWDLLALDGASNRLIDHAVVAGGLSPAISSSRRRSAPGQDLTGPGYAVVDPGSVRGRTGPLYPSGFPARLVRQLRDADDDYPASGEGVTADLLAYALHRAPSRLLYLGHIRAGHEGTPAAAALVLRGRTVDDPELLTAREWLADPDRWPCPARVALVGCASDDSAAYEQSGLVVAAVNAGAQLVTSTRWPLPADHPAPRPCTPTQPLNHEGLTDLALAVHAAHRQADPLKALRIWQVAQLDRWRGSGEGTASPLLWASAVTYSVPKSQTAQ